MFNARCIWMTKTHSEHPNAIKGTEEMRFKREREGEGERESYKAC